MVVLRRRFMGAELAPFGLAALFFVLGATRTGHQEPGPVMVQQPAVSERVRAHIMASPLGAVQPASFGLPRPLGTAIPEPPSYALIGFQVAGPEVTGTIPGAADSPRQPASDDPARYPTVNRAGKGDRLVPRLPLEMSNEPSPAEPIGTPPPTEPTTELMPSDLTAEFLQPPPAIEANETDELEAAVRYKPFPEYDISLSLEFHPKVPGAASPGADTAMTDESATDAQEAHAMFGGTRLFFDGAPMSARLAPIEPWAAGEAPIVIVPSVAVVAVSIPSAGAVAPAFRPARSEPTKDGVSIAGKGEVTGEGRRPMSPAERLRLDGKARIKAERCLANAVYFESRGESVRGQIAVAQVVLNRAFSGFYAHDICGVVYQGANRHLSCQFTFACDGIPDVVTEPEPWDRAKRVAKAALDGKVWLNEVGKATHYHANWVTPYWVRSMRRLHKIGVHSFYRPRNWGNGAEAPSWGSVANMELAASL